MKDFLIVPETSGPVTLSLANKTVSDKLRAYQQFITILFTNKNGYMRPVEYGTPLLSSLVGTNMFQGFLEQLGGLAVSECLAQLDQKSRSLIDTASVKERQDNYGLIITINFLDGTSIAKEFT